MSDEILFLAHRVPYPPNRGDKIRSWHLLRAVAKIAPVHVCALWDDERDLEHLDFLRSAAASVQVEPANPSKLAAIARALLTGNSASVSACWNPKFQACVNQILLERPIRTILAFSGQMAQFVPANRGNRRFVMDFVDMDSAKFEAFGGLSNKQEAKRLFAFEKATAERADVSMFVSDAEAEMFRSKTGMGPERVIALENGIDLEAFDPTTTHEPVWLDTVPLIVFTGQMDYRPNVEAVCGFARDALPAIRASHPEARFAIVGRNPAPDVAALALLPGVLVTGEVADTRQWLAAADVVVAPLKLARGIQNKVLEAMAMAKPVVASPAAAEGIDATELVVADGPAQAEAVLTLLNNPAAARKLGEAARKRMIARYGWDARLAQLPAILGFAS